MVYSGRSPVAASGRRRTPGKLRLATAALAAFLAGQLLATVRNTNRWPFCSYNMFGYDTPLQFEELRVRLLDDAGSWTPLLDTWGLLPFDFFRVISVLDEVKASLRPPDGRRFEAFELYLLDIDLEACDPFDRSACLKQHLLYRSPALASVEVHAA